MQGFGSRILKRLIEQYLYIGYIDVNVLDSGTIEVLFFRGITRIDLSETHCKKFINFLDIFGINNYTIEKIHIDGPHDANFYLKCKIEGISFEELAGLIRMSGGGNANT